MLYGENGLLLIEIMVILPKTECTRIKSGMKNVKHGFLNSVKRKIWRLQLNQRKSEI